MKRLSSIFLGSLLLICFGLTISSWADQIVCDETRLWAKKALQQEKNIRTRPASNTLAVLYFHNRTGLSKLDLLQKGLAIVLVTDLSNVKGIQLVERVNIQALVEELGLGVSGLVQSEAAPRVGRLLGVELLVGGDILKRNVNQFQLKADLLREPTEKIFAQPAAAGKLVKEFFQMEKELLFGIINELRIELSPKKNAELKKPLTDSLPAILHLFEGIEYSDRGDFKKAKESYGEALKHDPNLIIAQQALKEVKSMLGKKTRPCRGTRNRILKGIRR